MTVQGGPIVEELGLLLKYLSFFQVLVLKITSTKWWEKKSGKVEKEDAMKGEMMRGCHTMKREVHEVSAESKTYKNL